MRNVYPFQIIGAKFGVDNKRVLLADEPGMFKTSQAIMAKARAELEEGRDLKTLVVCPNSVREHWRQEFFKWYHKNSDSRIVIAEPGRFGETVQQAPYSDAVIVNYELMSRLGTNGDPRLAQLDDVGFDFVVLDEVQNGKNPTALRSNSIKRITDRASYLMLLSGTPVTNDVTDIYMIMSYLQPDQYKFPQELGNRGELLKLFYGVYMQNPKLVKAIFSQRMLRREIQDYLDVRVPRVDVHRVEVPLNSDHRRLYENLFMNPDVPIGRKFRELEKALLDPNLVRRESLTDESLGALIGSLESSKYQKLDELVEDEIDRGGKVIIYTPHFKVGVTPVLQRRYSRYGAIILDGDVSAYTPRRRESARETLRRRFQNDPNTNVLITTTTMNEGVDLTAATSMIVLGLPYTPAQLEQMVRRSARYGEIKKEKFDVYELLAVDPEMRIPTLDEGLEQLLEDKRRIIDFLLHGYEVTKEDLDLFKEPQKVSRIKNVTTSPIKVIFDHFFTFRRRGETGITKFLQEHPEFSGKVPDYYLMQWNYSLPGNTAKVYTEVIRGLQRVEDLGRKLDIASGPDILSWVLNEPTVSVDIDPSMLKAGEKIKHPDTQNIWGRATQLPLADNNFDLAVMSLAYQMTRPVRRDKIGKEVVEVKEREQVVREASRVLREGGYFIVTMPYSCLSPEDIVNFREGMYNVGLEMIPELTGYVEGRRRAPRTAGVRFKIFMTTARKYGNANKEEMDSSQFTFYMDRVNPSRKQKKEDWQIYHSRLPGEVSIFDLNGNVVDLTQAIAHYTNSLQGM